MRANELPDLYFSSVQARDIDRFVSLFADDAIMILPDGREISGVAAIRKMELSVFESTSPPSPRPVSIVTGEDAVAVEIAVHLPSGAILKMANFVELNSEGRIKRLSVYRKTG